MVLRAQHSSSRQSSAVASLLTGAAIWGLIWYPYRYLAAQGMSGTLSATASYALAGLFGLVLCLTVRFVRGGQSLQRESWHSRSLWLLGLCVGLTNVSFVWATIHGAVLRVVLLFYLCPVWTALFARWLLGERFSASVARVIMLGLSGALVMLWRPDQGWPFPQSLAEWVGLGSGMMFALSNVLLRKIDRHSRELKTLWVVFGCAGIGLLGIFIENSPVPTLSSLPAVVWILMALLGAILLLANWIVQYGIERLPANRVAVIYLFELIVAGLSGWYLASESFGWQEAAGALLISVASVLAARIPHSDH